MENGSFLNYSSMIIDYRFWYIRRDDDVHISEAAIRFYEGDFRLKPGDDVPTYARDRKLEVEDLPFLASRAVQPDADGGATFLYTEEDFGRISDDEELIAYLNKELRKDLTRNRLPSQSEEDVSVLRSKVYE
jgi:hypothetical protein